MCGVTALYAYHPSALAIDRSEIERMDRVLASRGPDGRGVWYSEDGRVGLGHRRLAIIDPDARAAQPMASACGRYLISFNGEIYNHRELRGELEARGHRFRTESDTEVVLAAWAEFDTGMFQLLRGMYAFACWDTTARTLLLARDPYGIKPLYFADDGWTLRVASQVRALRACGGVSDLLEPAGQVGFLLFGSVPEPYTCYQEIRAVPAGTWIRCDAFGPAEPVRHCRISDMFRIRPDAPDMDEDAIHHTVRAAIQDSARHHLVSDVPVGVFLSGGVDSGALVGAMRDLGQTDVQTITLQFDEFRGLEEDESVAAEEVGRRYGTRHHARLVTRGEFDGDWPRILEAMDQPTIDGVNTWFVSKSARELGLKVALSGLGGDELFGGYDGFLRIPRWVHAMRVPGAIPGLGRALRVLSAPLLGRQSRVSAKIAGVVELGGTWAGAYLLKRGLFMPWELGDILGTELVAEGLARLSWRGLLERSLEHDPGDDFARVATLEASQYLLNQLLRDADWASMAHSVEVRTPFVDATLTRALGQLGCLRRFGTGKTLLADVPSEALPESVRRRRKTGFNTPMSAWLGPGPDRAVDPRRTGAGARRAPDSWARRMALTWARREAWCP